MTLDGYQTAALIVAAFVVLCLLCAVPSIIARTR